MSPGLHCRRGRDAYAGAQRGPVMALRGECPVRGFADKSGNLKTDGEKADVPVVRVAPAG